SKNNPDVLHENEISFQKLWKSYFESTNIKSRKNTKLHLQHVPKRYWKYLTEKTIFM
ncbi:MAG TPA: DNA metabolism protein, partial [Zunongwangia profunda]|nr:DNA metabolism protein [Zunongwangia profunda]